MAEMQNLAELINLKLVKPVQERFRQQKEALRHIEDFCGKFTETLEQQKAYIAALEQKIADLTEKQQQLQNALADECSRQKEMESAISAINWEE